MAAGFPLSRQAPQPEQTTQPPAANEAPNRPSPSRPAAPTPRRSYLFANKRPQPVNTDRWYYRVFQSAHDLIRSLLAGTAAAANALDLDPGAPGNQLYRYYFSSRKLRLRSIAAMKPLKSKSSATASSVCAGPGCPVVLLDVQMHPDQGFQHRLAGQSCRFLQKHTQVEHLEVVVITPTYGCFWGRCTGSAWRS
jgi:hypothetical protein